MAFGDVKLPETYFDQNGKPWLLTTTDGGVTTHDFTYGTVDKTWPNRDMAIEWINTVTTVKAKSDNGGGGGVPAKTPGTPAQSAGLGDAISSLLPVIIGVGIAYWWFTRPNYHPRRLK